MILDKIFRKRLLKKMKNIEFLIKEQRINLDKYTIEQIEWMDMITEYFRGSKGKLRKINFKVSLLTREKLQERAAFVGMNKERLFNWLLSIGAVGKNDDAIYNVRTCIPGLVRYIKAITGEDYLNEKDKKGIKKVNTKKHLEVAKHAIV